MDFYHRLNQLINSIESHLDTNLRLPQLIKQHGLSMSVVEHIFPLLAGMGLSEYVRKRRLTLAGRDLAQGNLRVIDIALKYGYESSAAFSRAFEKFHGLKPSEVKAGTSALKYCHKLVFRRPDHVVDVDYEVVELSPFKLFGLYVDTNNAQIHKDAPQLYLNIKASRPELPCPDYGLVDYRSGRDQGIDYRYWALWQSFYPGLHMYELPASRWLKFRINSQEAAEIQRVSRWFFENFLATCCYELKDLPDLEFYHNNITDFLVPIQ